MRPSEPPFRLRKAIPSDVPTLRALIERSVRKLQAGDYTPRQIAGALGTVLGVDTQLIEDGTYFVVETPDNQIVGCGGWSNRKTLFGSDHAAGRESGFLDPACDAAKIRAFFVHPDWARQGIGSLVLNACERAATDAGFLRFELGATLTGERLYRVRGYSMIDRVEVPLANGESLPVIRMQKRAGPS